LTVFLDKLERASRWTLKIEQFLVRRSERTIPSLRRNAPTWKT
jgi:hypothetical protein